MRQASWNEMFAPRGAAEPLAPEVPQEPRGWRRFFWWEELLTFALVSALYFTVVASIDRAHWVDDMPSLYPIALLGLVMGVLLARVRWPEGFLHLLALPVGAAAMLGQILSVLPGSNPVSRFQTLTTRMGDWFNAAFSGGISNDSLPFIVSVVALTWLAAYFSSWAVFRWQNAWLALVPGGAALLANISAQPGQFSFAFIFFLFAGAVLVTRLHLLRRASEWRERNTPYPQFLSLSVLHATFWLALGLVVLAWLMPQANEVAALESLWSRATSPITERAARFSRLFVSVRGNEEALAHRFGETLPFQSGLQLSDQVALEVITEYLEQPRYLRADVYEIYTPEGWQQASRDDYKLNDGSLTGVDANLEFRDTTSVRIVPIGRTGDKAFTIGQPRRLDRKGSAAFGADFNDVVSLEIEGGVEPGRAYQTVGSTSVAPESALREAGGDYPDWVLERYLQLPDDFPASVRTLAFDLTLRAPLNYDKALAIETYVRRITYDLGVPAAPAGEDAIEYFIFDAQRGYFDYHASAMVVMLRSVGIPSRLAVGYALQGVTEGDGKDQFVVTELDAFAWPEVYFPGLGWVEFNPSPNLPLIERSVATADGTTTTDPNAPDGGVPGALDIFFPDSIEGDSDAAPLGASDGNGTRLLIAALAALAAVVVSTAGGLRFAWVRGLGGLEPPARLWGQTVRLASWTQLPLGPAETPREYARSLREQVPELEGVDLLADSYVRHRFGRWQPEEQDRARLETAWRAVRGRLLRRFFHRR